jgi:hypothetical protein
MLVKAVEVQEYFFHCLDGLQNLWLMLYMLHYHDAGLLVCYPVITESQGALSSYMSACRHCSPPPGMKCV